LAKSEKNSQQELGRRTRDQVLSITRRVLTDLAGASLEERVVEVFNQRLRTLDGTEIKNLASALNTRDGVLTVRTALDISPDLRATTEASIREILGTNVQLAFENAPAMICGIELDANGQKVAWSIADYLSDIKESSDEFLKKRIDGVKPGPEKTADGDEA
jgi:F-type H+-transporting ATPase subunit b